MPSNELLECRSGAKEALRLLRISKEKNGIKNVNKSKHSSPHKNKQIVCGFHENNHIQKQISTSHNELYNNNVNVKFTNVPSTSTSNGRSQRDNLSLIHEE